MSHEIATSHSGYRSQFWIIGVGTVAEPSASCISYRLIKREHVHPVSIFYAISVARDAHVLDAIDLYLNFSVAPGLSFASPVALNANDISMLIGTVTHCIRQTCFVRPASDAEHINPAVLVLLGGLSWRYINPDWTDVPSGGSPSILWHHLKTSIRDPADGALYVSPTNRKSA